MENENLEQCIELAKIMKSEKINIIMKNIKKRCDNNGLIVTSQMVINEYNRLNRIENTNIYFIQCNHGGPIKIGKTHNITKRLSQIQANCPYKLKIILLFENENEKLETFLHEKLSNYRLHGEWFKPEIINYLEDVINEYEKNN